MSCLQHKGKEQPELTQLTAALSPYLAPQQAAYLLNFLFLFPQSPHLCSGFHDVMIFTFNDTKNQQFSFYCKYIIVDCITKYTEWSFICPSTQKWFYTSHHNLLMCAYMDTHRHLFFFFGSMLEYLTVCSFRPEPSMVLEPHRCSCSDTSFWNGDRPVNTNTPSAYCIAHTQHCLMCKQTHSQSQWRAVHFTPGPSVRSYTVPPEIIPSL